MIVAVVPERNINAVVEFWDMKMPPETLRKSHHFIYRYDLGKYKDIPTEQLERELTGKSAEVQTV